MSAAFHRGGSENAVPAHGKPAHGEPAHGEPAHGEPAHGEPVHGERTVLRRAEAADADRLVSWHAHPDVSRYWDGETFTREQMLERLARDDVAPYIVLADGEPVGYLQVHETGLDMFLAPSARGRGLGPDAARAMARHLLDDRGWTRVTVDPYLWNAGARSAWAKAGFVPVSHHGADDEHTAPWVLMELR